MNLVTILLSAIAVASMLGQAASQTRAGSAEERLRRFVRALDRAEKIPYDPNERFVFAEIDLNDDGKTEVILYLIGRWCGTGGCPTFVLQREGDGYREISRTFITNPPIVVLDSKSKGWHNLGVFVEGGGLDAVYELELKFDGHTYPKYPDVALDRHLALRPPGRVVITDKSRQVQVNAEP